MYIEVHAFVFIRTNALAIKCSHLMKPTITHTHRHKHMHICKARNVGNPQPNYIAFHYILTSVHTSL